MPLASEALAPLFMHIPSAMLKTPAAAGQALPL
jgi:hypothetical protein